jgi:hypothetical protein
MQYSSDYPAEMGPSDNKKCRIMGKVSEKYEANINL